MNPKAPADNSSSAEREQQDADDELSALDGSNARRHYRSVRGCLRGLQVLEAVNSRRCATLPEVVRDTGLPRATVLRLLETLQEAGYVSRDDRLGSYEPMPRVGALSLGFNFDAWMVAVTTPILRRLLKQTGWPSDLMMLRGDEMFVRNSNRKYCALAVNRDFEGMRSPLAASAAGRTYLAWCTEAEREKLLRMVSGISDRQAIDRELQRTRERGYGVRDPALKPHYGAMAVPVMVHGTVLCCVDCVYLPQVTTQRDVAQRCLSPMREAAAALATVLDVKIR